MPVSCIQIYNITGGNSCVIKEQLQLYSMDRYLSCILTAFIFYAFGLKWCYEYAKCSITVRYRDESNTKKAGRFVEKFGRLINNHPVEGSMKLIATFIGLIDTITGGLPLVEIISPKVAFATIYLFFASSGLVDILHFYFPHNVSHGLVKLALAQSFFIEGYLFVWGNVGANANVGNILALIVWTTSLATALEVVWPPLKLLRAWTSLLHSTWLAHMIPISYAMPIIPEGIALAFSWHVAAASAVTLCVVATTRSCAAKLIMLEPLQIPIYDYRQEPDRKI